MLFSKGRGGRTYFDPLFVANSKIELLVFLQLLEDTARLVGAQQRLVPPAFVSLHLVAVDRVEQHLRMRFTAATTKDGDS